MMAAMVPAIARIARINSRLQRQQPPFVDEPELELVEKPLALELLDIPEP
jgi:hypothetical protein